MHRGLLPVPTSTQALAIERDLLARQSRQALLHFGYNYPMLSHSTATSLAMRLREDIDAGAWSPGMVLRQEELANRYGSSRIPVREALQTLASEGLIEIIPNRGARIASLTATQVEEIFELRLMLETHLLVGAIPHHNKKTLVRLKSIQAELDVEDTRSGWLSGDRRFHEALYEPALRPLSLEFVMTLRGQVQRYALQNLDPDTRRADWKAEHHGLIDAIKERDIMAASAILRQHLNETREEVLRRMTALKLLA